MTLILMCMILCYVDYRFNIFQLSIRVWDMVVFIGLAFLQKLVVASLPPLPLLEWNILKPYKKYSLLLLEGVEYPTPSLPPLSIYEGSIHDVVTPCLVLSIQKGLIEVFYPPNPSTLPSLLMIEISMQDATSPLLVSTI